MCEYDVVSEPAPEDALRYAADRRKGLGKALDRLSVGERLTVPGAFRGKVNTVPAAISYAVRRALRTGELRGFRWKVDRPTGNVYVWRVE